MQNLYVNDELTTTYDLRHDTILYNTQILPLQQLQKPFISSIYAFAEV